MSNILRRITVWTPRILGLVFAGFISLFALDVFGAGYGFWETIAAFLIHLIPTAIILLAVGLAWRWPWVGAILFVALGVWYLMMTWGQFAGSTYLIVAGPAFLLGVLFLVSWLLGDKGRAAPGI